MTALPRGIRALRKRCPPASIDDPADLRGRKAVFGRQSATGAATFSGSPGADGSRINSRNLCGDALLAILHGPVPPHIHLVVSVGVPSQIAYMVVSGVPVIVGNVGKPVGVWQKSQCNKPVRHSTVRLRIARFSKDVGGVAKGGDGAPHRHRRVSPRALGVSPLTGLPSIAPKRSVFTNLVIRKFGDDAPLEGSHNA